MITRARERRRGGAMCDESGFGVHVPEFYIIPEPGLMVPTRRPDGMLEDARPTNGYVYERSGRW